MATRLSTTTNNYLLPKVADSVLRENNITTLLLSNPEKWNGEYLKKVVKVAKNPNTTSFGPFDLLPSQAVNTRQYLSIYPKQVEVDVTLALTEMAVNATDEDRILDLAETEMTSNGEDLADNIGTQLYGNGLGSSGRDFDGLGNIFDDGTVQVVYNGLSRTTYPTLQSPMLATTGTLNLVKMATEYNNLADGTVIPTRGLTDRASYSYYEQLIEPKNRIYLTLPEIEKRKTGLAGTAGFTTLAYKGFPIIADRKCTTGYMYFINEDFLHFTAVEKIPMMEPVRFVESDIEGNDYKNIKGLGFHWTGWVRPTNQLTLIGRIIVMGQAWTDLSRRGGALTGIANI